MRFASSLTTTPDLSLAVAELASQFDASLDSRAADLVIAFAPGEWLSDPKLAEALAAAFPRATVVGCSAAGVIGKGREVEDRAALSLTVASLPDVRVRSFHVETSDLPAEGDLAGWRALAGVPTDEQPHFLLFCDPFTMDTQALLQGLDGAHPDAQKLGGYASGGQRPGSSRLLVNRELHRSGAVGVVLSGNVEVDAVIAQGCRPVGQPMFVTRCEKNLIQTLNDQAPLDMIRQLYAGLPEGDQRLLERSLHLGIEMKNQVEYGQGDFLVRNILGLEQERGGMAIAGSVRPLQVVQFVLRDAQTATQELQQLLSRYRAKSPVRGALLFSCLGRGRQFFGEPDHDSSLFRKAMGELPLGGFFCNGEIGPVGGTTFLHAYTSAFALFRAKG